MHKEKSLGQILGEKVLASLSSEEREKVVTITLSPLPNKEIEDYLDKIERFKRESRKVNIISGGDGCDYCKNARELQQSFSLGYSP
jgi:hypothetical protein